MTLRAAAMVAVAVNVVAAIASIDAGLPADWGGFLDGDPDNVLADFLGWRGPAIAPPLVMIVALAVLAMLVPERRAAAYGLALLGLAGVVGYLGEPATWELGWPAALAWVGVLLYATMAVVATRAVRREPHARPVPA